MTVKLRCQALDMNEKQCTNRGIYIEHYVGDAESYAREPFVPWVTIVVCKTHQLTKKGDERYIGKA